jgi:Carboxypeptidase regulatory-like domain/TonB dependent receptor
MVFKRIFSMVLACLASATLAHAQGSPTGTISGRVSSDAGALPGVTVTATSPALQGSRTAVTSENGDFILPLLPPGSYTVVFELQGFRTVRQTASVAAAQTVPIDVSLGVAGISETVNVEATIDNFAQLATVSSSYRAEEIAALPTDRSLNATILFAPGVFNTGPSTNSQDSTTQSITIGGAMSFENLFLVNGVVVNENLRGQAVPLFIEDAMQETSISTAAISAEFGRFSGGVVNAVTKSGGNNFSGSFRTTLTNDDWRALTPQPNDVKVDDVVPTYEFTAGGPIARDHLWFFGAGRIVDRVEGRQTTTTNVPYTLSEEERRYEGKLTYSVNSNHTVRGSYIYRNRNQFNTSSFTILDLRSLYDRSLPDDLRSVNYTGVISPNFFVEGTYSNRNLKFVDAGAKSTDLVEGTLVVDQARASRYWAPTFCGVCGLDEERNNENFVVKGTYFKSTRGSGSHSLVFGFDTFNDVRLAENHQSGSDYRILGTTALIRGSEVYPSWTPGSTTLIQWNPIDAASLGTDFRTHSLFVNDQWRVNNRLTANVGVRWDRNDGVDSAGNKVASDSGFSPRFALTFDPTGNSLWTINGSYGKYIAGLANNIADSASNGGVASTYLYEYLGPAINTDVNAPTSSLIPTDVALRTLYDWFFANGGTNRPVVGVDIAGVSTRIGDGLKSPGVHEFTAGVTRQIGGRGLVRVDGVYRTWSDFYFSRRDVATGTVLDPTGVARDLTVIGNSTDPERQYTAMNLQASYRFGTRLHVNGVYTLSRTWGNFDGETVSNGPITAGSVSAGSAVGRTGWGVYPEYYQAAWNRPVGDLATDQRHRARMWAVWQVPVSERLGSISLSVLEQINTGSPYFAAGPVNPSSFVTNTFGYQTPPNQAAYFFTDRDAFRTDTVYRTDLAVNYSYRMAKTELFFQTQLWNVFNQSAIADVNNIDVTTRTRDGGTTALTRFNPFADTPQQGLHWEPGPNFGLARNKNAYQLPRQIRFSMGVRF